MALEFIAALAGLPARRERVPQAPADHHPGQRLVAYALHLSAIALAVVVALVVFGDRLAGLYGDPGSGVPN